MDEDKHLGIICKDMNAQCILCGEVMTGIIVGDDDLARDKCDECKGYEADGEGTA